MSDTVYAIASGKGGVGKTTTAVNLGAMLADRDHSVVVVDTDLGMANLADFLDFEIETPTLHEVLAGEAEFENAIYRAPGDIDVLPSATDIEAFVKSDPANLQAVVEDLREEYDYVLLDTGAGVSYDTLVPLALADGVLLVATPDVASVRDTAKTGELAERVESEVTGAVLTQRSSDILNADDVEETLGTDVLAVVPQDEAVPMGIDAGRPLAAFAPNAPAGQAYRELAAVLTGDADPDPELEATDAEDPQADDTRPSESEVADAGAVEDEVTDTAVGGSEIADAEADESETSDAPASDAEATDDPFSADAARNVRDAIGGESDGETSTLFGEESAESAETASESPETTDESSETASEARSVDDLINEHISDERLGETGTSEDEDADPLAQMGGDLSADDSADDPLAGEEGDSLETASPDETGEEAEASDESEWGETNDDGENSGVSGVPFEDDESSLATDRERGDSATDASHSERETGPHGEQETDPLGEREPAESAVGDRGAGDSSERDRESDGSASESDSFEDDESDENGGVLGRLGALFK
ncbi:cell division ATPase MinD [Halorussus salinisoli]|uniref:cell division ATPase MinD n=1 Tax=Halorussus salinisoli TaxID=2558242 RepID=UPI0010C1F505|nr:cell division ATPase MinD [Halorussus salinisoli]